VTEWRGRRALVVGLGVSGRATAVALLDLGAAVTVTEASSSAAIEARAAELRARGARVETGAHCLERLAADVAFVSPGIHPDAPVVAALRAAGIPVMGEIELAARLTSCDVLAVTGTNGKTTTTSLLAAILQAAGIAARAAGNIGTPMIEAATRADSGGALVVEVSSFQLDATETFRPRVAVLLNVAEDHTDWHAGFDAYARAKERVVAHQRPDDWFVFNQDDAVARAIASRAPSRTVPFSARRAPRAGIGVRDGDVVWRGAPLMAAASVPLPGVAGLEDALAASAAALCYGVDPAVVAGAVERFRPLPHRLEEVVVVDGVAYVDDSKATNPHATLAALEGGRDVVLIAGGRAKGIDLRPLGAGAPALRAVVAMGEAAPEVVDVFAGLVPVVTVSGMDDAVAAARHHAVRGGSVLLSPACASLDMYESYAARGDDFARAVRALASRESDDGHT